MPRRAKNEVFWTLTAEGDLSDIVGHIAMKSPGTADSVIRALLGKSEKLRQFPSRGRIVPELDAFGVKIYREVVKAPWRIIYRVEKNAVFVMAVVDSRRNVEDLLLRRFLRGDDNP